MPGRHVPARVGLPLADTFCWRTAEDHSATGGLTNQKRAVVSTTAYDAKARGGDVTEDLTFDLEAAHRYFSVECFNKAWELLDKADRSAEEDEEMIRLSLASHWHWTRREDCTPTSISVAYWQTSRIYAVLGQASNAKRYAARCLAVSQDADVKPFYLAYAYEAMARAERVAGDQLASEQYVKEARLVADDIADPEEKGWFLDDLATVASAN